MLLGIIGFILGCFVGACAGVFCIALVGVEKKNDTILPELAERYEDDLK